MVGMAKLVIAPDCGSGGRGFESLYSPFPLFAMMRRGFFNIMGCRQAVKAQDFDSCIRGFESRQPSNTNEPETFDLLRFPAHSLCIGEA